MAPTAARGHGMFLTVKQLKIASRKHELKGDFGRPLNGADNKQANDRLKKLLKQNK